MKPLHVPAIVTAVLLATCSYADDWPQWHGPERDGVYRETGLLESIPPGGLKVRWRARVGNGYSGPVVAQGRVFVTDHTTLAEKEVERVLCFDEATGNRLWAHSYPCDYEDMEYGNGPRASPTVHGGKVYTLGTKGHLFCLDAAQGTVLWSKDLVKDFAARIPRYGASAAPLVSGDLLIVCAGGQPDASVVALDRHTGKDRWRALKDRPAYSAPIEVTAGGRRQCIVWTADAISGLEPDSGKVFWQVPRKTTFDEAEVVASPVVHKDRVLCLAAWGRSSLMLTLDPARPDAAVLWKTRQAPTTMISTPVFQDERHFYAILGNGRLACLDAASGDEVWSSAEPTSNKGGTAHLTPLGPAADRAFLFNQSGHLVLVRLTPKGYEELGRTLLVEPTSGYRAQGPVCWTHPAYANKSVFARNDREMVCASLALEKVARPPSPAPVKSRVLGEFTGGKVALGVAFSPDGKTLALGTWSGEAKLVDIETGKGLPGPTRHRDWISAVAFSRDGKQFVSAGGNEFKPARNDGKTTGEVKLWDLAGRTERSLKGHTNKVFAAVFSPDSRTLATGSADGTARLWDAATGEPRSVLPGHKDAVYSVAFTPDSKRIATAGVDGIVRMWDVGSGKEHARFPAHDEEILAVAISPDGKTLATAGADWTIRLWDAATIKPDARPERMADLKGHNGRVYCLAFTSDSKTLASGSGDQTVKLWDIATRAPRATLEGHRSGISSIAFAPNDRALASSGWDDAVRLWDLGAP